MNSILLLISLLFVVVNTKHLPTYITACRKNDPNLNKCALENAKKALPYILKGDQEYKIPTFVPLKLPLIEVYPSNDIVFKLKNITLNGLDSMDLKDMTIDLVNHHISLKCVIKQDILESQYEINGKILNIAIQGNGPARIVSDDIDVDFAMDFKLINKDGVQYIDIKTLKSELKNYTVGKVHYNFENLFGGNKLLSDNFNQFLNDNAKEVDSIAGATNRQIVNQIVFEVFKHLFRVVPYDEIFS